ncbi:MAG: inorganic pyrophosphatase [Saprospiraceae bacterium]|nr:inorganic pyrophosphatase [Saprospiraceae bacterium]
MFNKYLAHPWHGIDPGINIPENVTAFIEITPHDNVKYEVDKTSGLIKVDRPQLYSNIVPALYGFIPKTYCGADIAELCMNATGKKGIVGDGDPLDICVLTERNIVHGNILVNCKPIGGFRMIDNNEADDKIIAILQDDRVIGEWDDLNQLPSSLRERLLHYFLTYKQIPNNQDKPRVEITHAYGKNEAYQVIEASLKDYQMLISSQNFDQK